MGAAERISRASALADDSFDRGSLLPDEDLELDQWCVEMDGAIACLSTRQVWMALAQGRIGSETPVWRDGLGHWAPIADVVELTHDTEGERVSVPERSEIRVRRPRPTPLPSVPEEPVHGSALSAGNSWLVGALRRASGLFVARLIARPRALVGAVGQLARRGLAAARAPLGKGTALALVGIASVCGLGAGVHRARTAAVAEIPRAQRVAVDVAERARLLSARARMHTAEVERRFWHDGWQ